MEKFRGMEPYPSFSSEEMSGSDIIEPLLWLSAHIVDGIVLDGRTLIGIDSVSESQEGDVVVTCIDNEGASHILAYNPVIDAPLTHLYLGKPRES